jgi:very-short-patch-repair endonuclease
MADTVPQPIQTRRTLAPAEVRERIERVFRFLAEVARRRNPVVHHWSEHEWKQLFSELPGHPTIERGLPADGAARVLLRVARADRTACPPPPAELAEWLLPGWRDPGRDARHQEFLEHGLTAASREGPGGSALLERAAPAATGVRFADDPRRVRALVEWQAWRAAWRETELPARRALAVFQRLFELRGRLERESERVLLWIGDGMLRVAPGAGEAQRAGARIEYPLVLQRCELHFLPLVPAFEIRETDDPPELATALLQELTVDGRRLAQLRERLAAADCGVLDPALDALLTEAAHSLFLDCSFRASRGEAQDRARCLYRDPVLFIAPRSGGLANAIEGLLERLEDERELPAPLVDIVVAEELEARPPPAREEFEPLLTKPSNQQQEDVVRALHSQGDVVVQGPPGTGKTHTIANLVGHLLAEGKSVLVTSHSTKALRVLRDKVAEPLRPLCVSLLDRDQESRSQLEESVKGIIAGLNVSREERERLAAQAAGEREETKARLELARAQLRAAVAGQYEEILVGGSRTSPADAARIVRAEAGSFGWLPGPLAPGAALPLAPGALRELYASNVALPAQSEADLDRGLPDPAALLDPQGFEARIAALARERETAAAEEPALWLPRASADHAALAQVLEQAAGATRAIRGADRLALECMDAGRLGGLRREPWDDLLASFAELGRALDRAQGLILKHAPQCSLAWTAEERDAVCAELLAHARSGAPLRGIRFRLAALAKPRWRAFVEGTRVSGHAPRDFEELSALEALGTLERARAELRRRWNAQVAPYSGTSDSALGARPEDTARQHSARLAASLRWHDEVWLPIAGALEALGFRWSECLVRQPLSSEPCGGLLRLAGALERDVPRALAARAARLRAEELEQSLARAAAALEPHEHTRIGMQLAGALRQRDGRAYAGAWAELQATLALAGLRRRRAELLAQVSAAAPAWAEAIERRRGVYAHEQLPGDAERAWFLRQLQEELQRREAIDPDRVQQTIAGLQRRLEQETGRYVQHLAWARQHERTGKPEQAALKGWQATVNRRGFESGVMSARLKEEARKLLGEARTAVPVWIMPLARVVESYDFARTRFDVVIVDEASQCDMTGLVALGIATQAVVVGDDKQVSPVAVGEDLEQVQTLIDQFLEGVSNAHLYTGRHSLYDMATYGFGKTIRLTEHFRCVPEIIAFSNELSYQGEIVPLRESAAVATRPFVVAQRVADGQRALPAKRNEREAEEIASLVAAVCAAPEYAGKSLGVISLLGEEQALLIEAKLRERVRDTDLVERNLLCGVPAQFQGDERDVVFLSLVDSTGEGGPLSSNANNDDVKKRYNVAASRARDQLWVVHSLAAESDLRPGDFRRRLIEHAQDPAARGLAPEPERHVESEFERLVAEALVRGGYRLVPQWEVGAYRIDLVVLGAQGAKVALECDGDRYRPSEALQRDLERQQVLGRLGWRFLRLRSSSFLRDPEAALERVCQRLAELGIEPQGSEAAARPAAAADGLVARIRRRAAELRAEWREPGPE